METIKSLEYWEQDDHIDQKFYTAHSIIGSAIISYYTGKKLSKNVPSNWSNITFYYSMVFSTRLLLFLAVGDFPTPHRELCKQNTDRTPLIKCDWFNIFLQGKPKKRRNESRQEFRDRSRYIYQSFAISDLTDSLREFNPDSIQDCDEIINEMRHILYIAKFTRNNENYDSLIIYHHFDHLDLSIPIKNLSGTLESMSKRFIIIALSFFRKFIKKTKEEDYLAFLNWRDPTHREGIHYLADTLFESQLIDNREEINGFFTKDDFFRLMVDENLAKRVHENIIMTKFDSKTNLMKQFKENVRWLSNYQIPDRF